MAIGKGSSPITRGGLYSSTSLGGRATTSSLGIWITTLSGNGVLGPSFPVGSQSSMILTFIPRTPCLF
ncbi:putative YTH domain-containing protein [Helianthus anomalus]